MNKIMKKFLCKYFADGDDIVTVGSVISLGIYYSCLLISASILLYTFYSSIEVYRMLYYGETITEFSFKLLMGEIGVIFEAILFIIGFLMFLEYLSKIEITRCERKE